jgi:predicted nucleotide-binding protein (sugar kinase/HSP70/actin superfamily)
MGAYSNDEMIVVMETAELLKRLKGNRAKHKKEYEAAVKGWNEALHEAREDLRAELKVSLKHKVRKSEKEALDEYQRVLRDKPNHHLQDYDTATEMLELHCEDTYKIERDQFRKFVQDMWDWKGRHLQTMAFYTEVN